MDIKSYKKEELYSLAENLKDDDIKYLLKNLTSSDDKLRYPSFLTLQYRSELKEDLYKYWNQFIEMTNSTNSYFKTIGLKMISTNTKWDWLTNKYIKKDITLYLEACNDEKLITARLAIQGLKSIINGTNFDKEICDKTVNKLTHIDIEKRPSTNLKVMTTDIVNILIEIEKEIDYKEIIIYLNNVLDKNIIDKTLKKQIEELIK